jgi:hypothetical protein
MDPVSELERGARELAETLSPAGFDFVLLQSGRSSGGTFASGEFCKADRHLELHFRWSLGLVVYHVGADSLAHDDFVRAVQSTEGIQGTQEYPGFSDQPQAAFRGLRADLERFGRVFISGTADEFRALGRWVNGHPKPTGFGALAR